MRAKQWKYAAAMLLIGDGVLAMLRPRQEPEAWNAGPRPWKAFMRYLADHPEMNRAIGAAETAMGLALVAGEERSMARMRNNEAKAMRARIREVA